MTSTVVLLVIFLAGNNVDALITTAIIYVAAALAHFAFTQLHKPV